MKIHRLIFICIAVAAASCGSKPAIDFGGEYADDKPFDSATVEFQPFQLDTMPLVPWNLCFLDSLLVVEERYYQLDKNFFKIYRDGQLISQFGKIGEGPDDFDRPNLESAGKAEQQSFYVTESTRMKQISLDSSGRMPVMRNLDMPNENPIADEVFLFNDSCIVFSLLMSNYQLQRYNRVTKETAGYNYFEEPGNLDKYSSWNLAGQLYQSSGSSNGKYAVLGYCNMKMIDVVSLSDMKLHKRICFRGFDCKDYEIDGKGNFVFEKNFSPGSFCGLVAAEEDRFFVKVNNVYGTSDVPSYIFEFDYDGNIKKRYKTSRPFSSYAIRNDEIFAIGWDENGESIIMKRKLE